MDNQSAIIQIQSFDKAETNGEVWALKISAQDKKVYNVPKYKKGTQILTVAWQQMTDMGLKAADPISGFPGSTVEIWYREVPNKHGGVSRYIASFKETSGTPTQSTQKPQSPPISQDLKPSEPVDWDRLGYIKAYHNLIAAYIAKGETYDQLLEHISNGHLWSLCKIIEEDVEKHTAKGWAKAEAIFKPKEELPTINQDEEMDDDLSSIPF